MNRAALAHLLLLAALGSCVPLAPAQQDAPATIRLSAPPDEATMRRALELQPKIAAAIDAKDYTGAEDLLLRQIELDPGNFVPRYNLACVRSLRGDAAGAMDRLIEAIERGFVDLRQMKTDPQLAAARAEPRFARLISRWPDVLARHLEANLAATREMFAQGTYAETRDEKLRIVVRSTMDAESTRHALDELRRLHAWALQHVMPDLAQQDASDAWTVVVLPSPRDFTRWIMMTYGQAAIAGLSGVGGVYLNDEKRLVAQDLGATLRHEFFHVLHWRSMIRVGQQHPIWIQEGLCSLVEDYEITGEDPATLRPVPSWRTNVALRLLRGGRILKLEELTRMPRSRFSGSTPLAHYGQARAVFLYLWDRGKLRAWYEHYTAKHETSYDADPSGLAAIQAVIGLEGAALEKDYRAWVRALPEVAEQLRPGAATIGVDVDPGTGDGPVIADIPRLKKDEEPPARRAGLRVGDVITAINGRPTRDLNELLRILGEFEPGQSVEVSYRRGTVRGTATITLVGR